MVAEDGHEMQTEKSLGQKERENLDENDATKGRKDKESQKKAKEETQDGEIQNESYTMTAALKHGDLEKR